MMHTFNVDTEVQKLLDMIYAPMYTKILFAAIELDLFSELEEEKTHTEVAGKLNLQPGEYGTPVECIGGNGFADKRKGVL